jgi:co-chaperonin GroES (HSP10)
MKVTAIGTNVVLKLNDRKQATEGGIALPSQYSKPETEGAVMSVGADVRDVQVGDTVGFPTHQGTRFTHGTQEFLIIPVDKLVYVRA